MKNQGRSHHRLKEKINEAELVFAKKWEEINNEPFKKHETLAYLICERINEPVEDEVTDRDRMVAASVIQWLGSPVGVSFLAEVYAELPEAERQIIIKGP